MPKKMKTDQGPTLSDGEPCVDTIHLPIEEELATVKALLVGVLKLMGGKVTIPLTYLDQFPYNGKLRTLVSEAGMVIEYTEPEGGD